MEKLGLKDHQKYKNITENSTIFSVSRVIAMEMS